METSSNLMRASIMATPSKKSALGRVADAIVSVLPKRKSPPAGLSFLNTFNPTAISTDLPIPGYRDHLTDVFSDRGSLDSRSLMESLFRGDPDVSAAVNGYLTVADVDPYFDVRDSAGAISPDGYKALQQVLLGLFTRMDYTQPNPFYWQKSLRALCEELRYMVLLRGGVMTELVLNKLVQPTELRHVDLATIRWQQRGPNDFLPIQVPKHPGSESRIPLDAATIFVSFWKQSPLDVYSYSPFVAAINTIAARQQIINDLYRIMQLTGYPRIDAKILEGVCRQNAPAAAKADEAEMQKFLKARLAEISSLVGNMRPDEALVHFDSVEFGMTNDKIPAMAIDVSAIITVLNAQNQAGLKVMSTIIGRGESGVNTASVEARIFALNAESLNRPIADILSQALTLAVRLQGVDAVVTVGFEHIELRPDLELEPQKMIQQARLLQLLSIGIISDDEFHFELLGRPAPEGAPKLQGTGFITGGAQIDQTAGGATPSGGGTQPNPADKVAKPPGSGAVKSKTIPKPAAGK